MVNGTSGQEEEKPQKSAWQIQVEKMKGERSSPALGGSGEAMVFTIQGTNGDLSEHVVCGF